MSNVSEYRHAEAALKARHSGDLSDKQSGGYESPHHPGRSTTARKADRRQSDFRSRHDRRKNETRPRWDERWRRSRERRGVSPEAVLKDISTGASATAPRDRIVRARPAGDPCSMTRPPTRFACPPSRCPRRLREGCRRPARKPPTTARKPSGSSTHGQCPAALSALRTPGATSAPTRRGIAAECPRSRRLRGFGRSLKGSRRIDHVLAGAPGEAQERISCGDGVKSPRATTGPRPS